MDTHPSREQKGAGGSIRSPKRSLSEDASGAWNWCFNGGKSRVHLKHPKTSGTGEGTEVLLYLWGNLLLEYRIQAQRHSNDERGCDSQVHGEIVGEHTVDRGSVGNTGMERVN